MNLSKKEIEEAERLVSKYWHDTRIGWLLEREDFLQDVFLEILSYKGKFDPQKGTWGTYIYFECRKRHTYLAKKHFSKKRNSGNFPVSADVENLKKTLFEKRISLEQTALECIPEGIAKIRKKIVNHKSEINLGITWRELADLISSYSISQIAEMLEKSETTIYIFRSHLIEYIKRS